MMLNQIECNYILALSYIELLLKDNFEIAFADAVRINVDEGEGDILEPITPEKSEQTLNYKKAIVNHFIDGLKIAESIQQTWLIFNGAIYVWNNYLPIFRNPSNDGKLLPEIINLLKVKYSI